MFLYALIALRYLTITFSLFREFLAWIVRDDGKDVLTQRRRGAECPEGNGSVAKSANRLEVYFVDGSGAVGEPVGLCRRSSGMVVKGSAGADTLGHEIGHFFGLDDIYCFVDEDQITIEPELRKPVDRYRAIGDWNNGTGTSFYAPELKQYELIQRLLMYGVSSSSKCDIPEGRVFGKPVEGELYNVSVGRSGLIGVP